MEPSLSSGLENVDPLADTTSNSKYAACAVWPWKYRRPRQLAKLWKGTKHQRSQMLLEPFMSCPQSSQHAQLLAAGDAAGGSETATSCRNPLQLEATTGVPILTAGQFDASVLSGCLLICMTTEDQ